MVDHENHNVKTDESPPRTGAGTPRVGHAYARSTLVGELGASSIEAQLVRCRERAVQDGVEIPAENEVRDHCTSGVQSPRPGLSALLKPVAADRIQVVYVYSMDRLARESETISALHRQLAELGIVVVPVT